MKTTNLIFAFLSVWMISNPGWSDEMKITPLDSKSPSSDRSFLISNPTHLGSKLYLSFYSDHDGVCRYLGYERSAKGSAVQARPTETIRIDETARGVASYNENRILRLICLNKTTPIRMQWSVILSNVTHIESYYPIHMDSPGTGVCRYFGYFDYAEGSKRPGQTAPSIVLNVQGNVTGVQNGATIDRIVCFQEQDLRKQ